jgi:hypothetical protein
MDEKNGARVLVIGRSPGVILDAADLLRGKGFHADATNQFDDVLTDYDTARLDVVVFGGMVPPATKEHLSDGISRVNADVTFVQGLAGIAGLIAAQVEGVSSTGTDDVAYDAATRTVRLTLHHPAPVLVDALWATSFRPPEPTSTSLHLLDSWLEAGDHVVPLPSEVPPVASFVTVSVGGAVSVFTVGALPDAVARLVPTGDPTEPPTLPPVTAVSTHTHD